jgi:parallel beta-helix repeat protein
VTFVDGEGPNSVLDGLTITGGNRGIFCSGTGPTIKRCRIEGNRNSGVRLLNQSRPILSQCSITANGGDGVEMRASGGGRSVTHNVPELRNCIIAGNERAGLASGRPELDNCTVVDNLAEGISSTNATLNNCILYFNDLSGDAVQITGIRVVAAYCDVQGGWIGDGNIDADPEFVARGQWTEAGWTAGDYHLKSQGWRWGSDSGVWTSDAVTSPCIDAGDPTSPLQGEPLVMPEGPVVNERINMGAYGGTAQASIAPLSD